MSAWDREGERERLRRAGKKESKQRRHWETHHIESARAISLYPLTLLGHIHSLPPGKTPQHKFGLKYSPDSSILLYTTAGWLAFNVATQVRFSATPHVEGRGMGIMNNFYPFFLMTLTHCHRLTQSIPIHDATSPPQREATPLLMASLDFVLSNKINEQSIFPNQGCTDICTHGTHGFECSE